MLAHKLIKFDMSAKRIAMKIIDLMDEGLSYTYAVSQLPFPLTADEKTELEELFPVLRRKREERAKVVKSKKSFLDQAVEARNSSFTGDVDKSKEPVVTLKQTHRNLFKLYHGNDPNYVWYRFPFNSRYKYLIDDREPIKFDSACEPIGYIKKEAI